MRRQVVTVHFQPVTEHVRGHFQVRNGGNHVVDGKSLVRTIRAGIKRSSSLRYRHGVSMPKHHFHCPGQVGKPLPANVIVRKPDRMPAYLLAGHGADLPSQGFAYQLGAETMPEHGQFSFSRATYQIQFIADPRERAIDTHCSAEKSETAHVCKVSRNGGSPIDRDEFISEPVPCQSRGKIACFDPVIMPEYPYGLQSFKSLCRTQAMSIMPFLSDAYDNYRMQIEKRFNQARTSSVWLGRERESPR